jgi:large exoprotein involved in heme utilization and adhesion
VLIGATGNAGAVNISTGELLLRNGAQVSAQTRGGGNAGGLVLTVDSLMVQSGSLVNARTFNNNNAGSLIVRAESVIVEGRDSAIDLDTRSGSATGGDAGILNINTQQLVVQNGGKVTAKTFGGGFGGFMQLNAAESITVDGAGSTLRFETSGTGDAIGISIDTGQLVVTNQGEITVSGTRSGSPGSLIINSGSILMESGGKVTASTLAEIGGDIMITLRPKGLLKMFNGSKIITSALETGDGGRITIRAPEGFVISNGRDKDNDVLAAAKQGRGGLIQAPPRARVFNFIESNVPTPDSDFTAGSETGIPGLTIFEPSREKQPEETIPLDLADPQIAQGCRALRARADESKFIITNRGGLPTNPTEALSGDAVQVDLVTRNPEAENRSGATVSIPSPPKPIVEAQGWVVDRDGTIVLVAHTPTATPAQFWHSQGNCEEVKR